MWAKRSRSDTTPSTGSRLCPACCWPSGGWQCWKTRPWSGSRTCCRSSRISWPLPNQGAAMSTMSSSFVRAVDFVPVPTRDLEAAAEFYGQTLGLPRSVYSPERNYSEFETGNVTLSVYNPEKMGMAHNLNSNPLALHVD